MLKAREEEEERKTKKPKDRWFEAVENDMRRTKVSTRDR